MRLCACDLPLEVCTGEEVGRVEPVLLVLPAQLIHQVPEVQWIGTGGVRGDFFDSLGAERDVLEVGPCAAQLAVLVADGAQAGVGQRWHRIHLPPALGAPRHALAIGARARPRGEQDPHARCILEGQPG